MTNYRFSGHTLRVNILGPDGIGKTTVCHEVVASLQLPHTDVRYRYGGRASQGRAMLVRRFMKLSLLVGSTATHASMVLRGAVGYRDLVRLAQVRSELLACAIDTHLGRLARPGRSNVVVEDRGVADSLIAMAGSPLYSEACSRVERHLEHFETLWIVLDADGAEVYGRKAERSIRYIDEKMKHYRNLSCSVRSTRPIEVVDTRGQSIRGTTSAVQAVIVGAASKKD